MLKPKKIPQCIKKPCEISIVCGIFSKKKDHGMWMLIKHSQPPEGSHDQVEVYRIVGRGKMAFGA
jgi:hypothetical protein